MTTETVISNVKENNFVYRGWNIEHTIDTSSCECCGISTAIIWEAHQFVDGKLEAIYDIKSLEELFIKINEIIDGEK